MPAPDIVRSEVVANGDGSARALEPEDRRVPVTLFRATSLTGDHLKAGSSKKSTSRPPIRRILRSNWARADAAISRVYRGSGREQNAEERFEPPAVRARGV